MTETKRSAKEVRLERRKFLRIPVRNIVRCQRYTIPPKASDEIVRAVSKNISAGGLLFESKRSFIIGDIVRLEIVLPGWERFIPQFYREFSDTVAQPLVIIGSVVRVEVIPAGTFDIGVIFQGIYDDQQWAIRKYIEDCLR